MVAIEDYVTRVEVTCDEGKTIIVTFKHAKKDLAFKKIFAKATVKKTIAKIVFELTFNKYSFRLYKSGKAIFRDLKDKGELNALLSELLT